MCATLVKGGGTRSPGKNQKLENGDTYFSRFNPLDKGKKRNK
jgi:hypothetical protein